MGIAAPTFGQCLCGQTAGWIEMPLGTEVGLGPGDIVLGEDPAPLPMEMGPYLLWPNGGPSQQLLSSCDISLYKPTMTTTAI